MKASNPSLTLFALCVCGLFMLSPRSAGTSAPSEGPVPRRQLRGRQHPVQLMSIEVHGSFSTNVDMCALEEDRRDRFVYGVRVALAETACGEDNKGCQTVTPYICDETHTPTRRMQTSTQQGLYSVSTVFDVEFVVTSSVVCQSQNCRGEQDVERGSTIKHLMERNLLWSFHMHSFEEVLRDVIGDWGENLVVEAEPTGLQKAELNDARSETSSASLVVKSAQGEMGSASGQYFPRMNGPSVECISAVDETPDAIVTNAGFVFDTYDECCEEFSCVGSTTTSSTVSTFLFGSVGIQVEANLIALCPQTTASDTRRYYPQIFGTTVVCIFSEPDEFVQQSGFVYGTYEECSEKFQNEKVAMSEV